MINQENDIVIPTGHSPYNAKSNTDNPMQTSSSFFKYNPFSKNQKLAIRPPGPPNLLEPPNLPEPPEPPNPSDSCFLLASNFMSKNALTALASSITDSLTSKQPPKNQLDSNLGFDESQLDTYVTQFMSLPEEDDIIHAIFNKTLWTESWEVSRIKLEYINRHKDKSRLLKQRNRQGQTPLLSLIQRPGIVDSINKRIVMNGKDFLTVLSQFIKEGVSAEFLTTLRDIVPGNLLRGHWLNYGFNADLLELTMLIVMYKCLECRYQGLLNKNYLNIVVNWII
jgi:hypothetical protein